MSARPFRLSRRHRVILYGLFALLFASGFSWWLADEAEEEAGRAVAWAETLKPWALRVHGAAAMAFLVALGTVLPLHAQKAWPSRINRLTGILLSGWFGLQALTGYGLLYLGKQVARDWAGQIHVTLGLLSALVLVGHILWGKRSMRRLRAPSSAASGG